jgi:hypothetical protein
MSYVVLLGIVLLTAAAAILAWALPKAPGRDLHRRRP